MRCQRLLVPRRPRQEAPGAVHHVVAQGNDRQRIVRCDVDRIALVRRLATTSAAVGWRCHAYCVMDTHLHALIETPEPNLGMGMQRLIGGYAYEFNRRHERAGHLFVNPYYSVVVERDEHLVAAATYVVLNPVNAGVCAHPADWPWCSYADTAGTRSSFVATELLHGFLAADPVLACLRYCAYVDQAVAELRDARQGSG